MAERIAAKEVATSGNAVALFEIWTERDAAGFNLIYKAFLRRTNSWDDGHGYGADGTIGYTLTRDNVQVFSENKKIKLPSNQGWTEVFLKEEYLEFDPQLSANVNILFSLQDKTAGYTVSDFNASLQLQGFISEYATATEAPTIFISQSDNVITFSGTQGKSGKNNPISYFGIRYTLNGEQPFSETATNIEMPATANEPYSIDIPLGNNALIKAVAYSKGSSIEILSYSNIAEHNAVVVILPGKVSDLQLTAEDDYITEDTNITATWSEAQAGADDYPISGYRVNVRCNGLVVKVTDVVTLEHSFQLTEIENIKDGDSIEVEVIAFTEIGITKYLSELSALSGSLFFKYKQLHKNRIFFKKANGYVRGNFCKKNQGETQYFTKIFKTGGNTQ